MEEILNLILIIFMRCCWGIICREMAYKRNRNPTIAYALGFLFTLFGVIGYAIAGNKK